jgi:hypothetical protein
MKSPLLGPLTALGREVEEPIFLAWTAVAIVPEEFFGSSEQFAQPLALECRNRNSVVPASQGGGFFGRDSVDLVEDEQLWFAIETEFAEYVAHCSNSPIDIRTGCVDDVKQKARISQFFEGRVECGNQVLR